MKRLLILYLLPYFMQCKQPPQATLQIWNDIAEGHYQICAKTFNIDMDLAKNYFLYLYLPDERPFHCFIKCIYDRVHFLTSEGDFDPEVVVNKVHFLSQEIVDKCIQEIHHFTDSCKKAYVGGTCAIAYLMEMDRQELTIRKT
ncbi:hypothetical protein RI129_004594 [Pyrocoelia pectoralis]|uniref:Uncharacterized protein n=1 Tax=Pyrocoelia pectoralis TaxID=417401 RepID=A0AAN7ZGW1_9COLE